MPAPVHRSSAPPVFLSAISYALGAGRALSEVDDPTIAVSIDSLRANGFESCRVSDTDEAELAAASGSTSLGLAGSPEIDSIVCASNASHQPPHTLLWNIMQGIGLPLVPGVVVGGNACANLALAVAAARNALIAEGLNNVLLMTTDRAGEGSRFEPNGGTVLSDGAASCLMSTSPPEPTGFRLLASSTAVSSAPTEGLSPMANARAVKLGIRRVAATLRESMAEPGCGYKYLIMGNYSAPTRKLFSDLSGFDPASTYTSPLSGSGHCFSADLLIGLSSMESDGLLAHGDRVLLLATSPRSWSMIAVEYLDAPFAGSRR